MRALSVEEKQEKGDEKIEEEEKKKHLKLGRRSMQMLCPNVTNPKRFAAKPRNHKSPFFAFPK